MENPNSKKCYNKNREFKFKVKLKMVVTSGES